MTDNTEPTIDELVEMCFDDLCINNTGNYIRITFGDKSMNVDYEHFLAFRKRIEALISDQVAKAVEQTFIPLSQLYDQYSDECFHLGISDSPQAFFRSEKVKEYLSTTLNGVKNK